ncbi:limbic system-associated membrane protein isoform X1 [Tachysurus ichikawai]
MVFTSLHDVESEAVTIRIPAYIYRVSDDVTVNEGSNVTLSCLANGRPDPSITWRLLNPSVIYRQRYMSKQLLHPLLILDFIAEVQRVEMERRIGRIECKVVKPYSYEAQE